MKAVQNGLNGAIMFLVILIAPAVYAQGPPINTDTPIMLGLEGRGVRTFTRVIRKTTLRSDGDKITDPMNREVTAVVTPVVVPYNLFSDKWQIGIIAPFVNLDLNRTGGSVSSSGIGGVKLFVKRLLYQYDRRNETFRIASKVGAKLPTGDENASLALGSGSTDMFFTTVLGWVKNRIGVFAEGIYNLNTTNDSLAYGDAFGFNLAFGYRLTPGIYERYPQPQVNVYLELNGSVANRNQLNDTTVSATGGTVVYLSPGAQFIGGRRWMLEGSFQYPIVNELHGVQLASDWTVSLGGRVLLF